jgi:aromatic ring-opening dioxygenase LigB subunit
MSLVFASIVPHTPVLLPNVGKADLSKLDQTRKALAQLEQDLYIAQPETLFVITPHGDVLPDALSVNFNGSHVADFSEFGDLASRPTWKSEIMLVNLIREDFKGKNLPLVLNSSEHLDYGTAVPLTYLTAHLPNVRIVPLLTSNLDMKTHFMVGRELKDEIMRSTKRVAVIASADLSPRAGEGSPAGFSPKGAAFDEKVLEIITKKTPMAALDIDEPWVAESQACGAKVVATLCGILDDVHHEPKILSYEKPLGVGYLVASMKIG